VVTFLAFTGGGLIALWGMKHPEAMRVVAMVAGVLAFIVSACKEFY
jgi:hypothetical protein